MNGYITQLTAAAVRPVSYPGEPAYADYPHDVFKTGINKDPQAKQIQTVTLLAAQDSTTYKATFAMPNGTTREVTYVTGAGTSDTLAAAALAAAIEADPVVRGVVTATSAAAVVTVTALQPNFTVTITDTSAVAIGTVAVTTAAAAADAIGFGIGVIAMGYNGTAGAEEPEMLCGIAKSTRLVAQVDTLTVNFVSGEEYSVTIEIDGVSRTAGPVVADTDDATTATAIRAAINAIMPANTVIATGATDQVILTAEVLGKGFTTSVGLESGTIANLALVNTTSGELTNIEHALFGVAVRALDTDTVGVGAARTESYAANEGVRVFSKGMIWVSCAETPAKGDPVYLELAGANTGKFFKASSSTRVKLPRSMARWERYVTAGSLGLLWINCVD